MVKKPSRLLILTVVAQEIVNGVKAGHAAGYFTGVRVAIEIEARFLITFAGSMIGQLNTPNISAPRAFTKREETGQFRMFQTEVFQRFYQSMVAVIAGIVQFQRSHTSFHPFVPFLVLS